MVIAVDASGGDYAPHEIVKGAIKAAEDYQADIVLVGNKALLHVLAGRQLKKLNIDIVDATQVIECHEPPMKAVRTKPNSSIVVGVNLVKKGMASAFISAGNTGAVVCAALLSLGKIKGIERPALCTMLDITAAAPVLLIDAGANVDCRPSFLVQFAELGTIYAKYILDLSWPRVSLLNNGAEETKGNRLIQQSYQLLKKTKLNFIGNIEGHDIPKRKADVIVTDGFTGNIVLKTIEGLGDTFSGLVRPAGQAISNAYHLHGRELLQNIGLGSWAKRVDYREYGGASLLGVNGNIIVAHGRSQAKAVRNAIGSAKRMAERDIPRMIKERNNG